MDPGHAASSSSGPSSPQHNINIAPFPNFAFGVGAAPFGSGMSSEPSTPPSPSTLCAQGGPSPHSTPPKGAGEGPSAMCPPRTPPNQIAPSPHSIGGGSGSHVPLMPPPPPVKERMPPLEAEDSDSDEEMSCCRRLIFESDDEDAGLMPSLHPSLPRARAARTLRTTGQVQGQGQRRH